MQIVSAGILRLEECHFPIACQISQEPGMMIYHVISEKAGFGWSIELFDIDEIVFHHYHNIQTQFIMLLEGRAKFRFGTHEAVLGSGQYAVIPPQTVHAIIPEKSARFLAIGIPSFDFSEDAYYEGLPSQQKTTSPFICENIGLGTPVIDDQTKLDSQFLEKLKFPAFDPKDFYLKNEMVDEINYA